MIMHSAAIYSKVKMHVRDKKNKTTSTDASTIHDMNINNAVYSLVIFTVRLLLV